MYFVGTLFSLMSIFGDNPSVREDRTTAIRNYANSLPVITIDEIELIGDTWDILLFSGNGAFSIAEEFVTNSVYSHVGTIFRDSKTNEFYNWESTLADRTVDCFSGKHKSGPRLIKLRESIRAYIEDKGTFVAYRKLRTPVKEDGTGGTRRGYDKDKMEDLVCWMKNIDKKMYEMKIWQLYPAYSKKTWIPRGTDSDYYFCSELVAESWKQGGIPLYRQSDLYSPQDFSTKDEALWTKEDKLKGYNLGKEYLIKLK